MIHSCQWIQYLVIPGTGKCLVIEGVTPEERAEKTTPRFAIGDRVSYEGIGGKAGAGTVTEIELVDGEHAPGVRLKVEHPGGWVRAEQGFFHKHKES